MTSLGKIASCHFGKGGYDDAMTGFTFYLETKTGSCCDFWGTWSYRSPSAKWTEEQQIKYWGECVARVAALLSDAGKKNFEELKDTPIEVVWNGLQLGSWRILKEVIKPC